MASQALPGIHRDRTGSRRFIQLVSLALVLVIASIVVASGTLIAGLSITEASALAAVLSVQLVVGGFTWLAARRGAAPRIIEVLGMGFVLGPLVFTILSALTFGLPWRLPSALVLCLMAALAAALGLVIASRSVADGRIVSFPTRGEIILLVSVMPLSVVSLLGFWAQVPLPRTILNWGTLSGDAAFHEAIARSIATVGPNDNLLASGHGLRYHWLSHAWAGYVEDVTGAATFVTTTRLLPLVAVVATVLLVWEWTRTLARRQAPAWLAVVLVLLSGTWTLVPGSPPQVWSTALSLSLVVIVWRGWRGEVRRLAVVAAVVSGAMVLSKASAIVLVCALFVCALVPLSRSKPHLISLRVASACMIASGLTLLYFTHGYGNSLKFSLTQTLDYLGFLPPGLNWHGALVIGLVLCATSLMLPWVGVANLAFEDPVESRMAFVFGGVVAGGALALTLLTGQWGQSQLYFAVTASAVLIPLSSWGVYQAFRHMQPKGLVAQGTMGIGVTLVLLVSLSPWPTGNWQKTTLIVVASAIAGLALQGASKDRRLQVWVAGATASIIIGFGLMMAIQTIETFWIRSEHAPTYGEWASNSISRQHIDALAYLTSVADSQSLIATNFLCDEPRQQPPDCLSIQFPVAALTGLPTLIEGYSYSVGNGPLPEWAANRVRWSTGFAQGPSAESLNALWGAGVRWVFIDKRRTSISDWSPFANTRFQNQQAAVLELVNPVISG